MIVNIDNDGSNRLIEIENNVINSILFADHNVLDNMRLEVLIIYSKINLLLSQPVLASEVVGLLDLQLSDRAIGSPLNDRLQNVDTAR